jgi:predicted phosphodiesterase
MKVKIVIISDTHEKEEQVKVPFGDILLHCGDFTFVGDLHKVSAFNRWLGTLPHPHKVIIAGNHDITFEEHPKLARPLITNAIYLEDSGTELFGIKIYGSPVQPEFCDWAFNRRRGGQISKYWDAIPNDTDVLITHGPPFKILDLTPNIEKVGCQDLLRRVQVVKPVIHCFGHIHLSYGTKKVGDTLFVNASICDEQYKPTNKPIEIEYDTDTRTASVINEGNKP